MKIFATFSLLVTALGTCNAHAQSFGNFDNWLGTTTTQFEPYLSEGKVGGCTLVFNQLVKDDKYDLGAYLKVFGNIGILATDNGISTNLKVAVAKMKIAKGKLETEPSKPSRAYLIASDFTTSQSSNQKQFDGETPGSIFVVMEPNLALKFIEQIVTTKKIDLAFNQRQGKSDLRTTIDFAVVNVGQDGQKLRSTDELGKFAKCLGAIADSSN